jgi:hypothetical protein
MTPPQLPLTPEDRDRIGHALQTQAAHLRGLAENDGPHVPIPVRRQWRQEAEECAELAQRFRRGQDMTGFRSGK